MKKKVDVFVNDFSLDMKSDFEDMLGIGMSIVEIENHLLQYIASMDDEYNCIFWTTLAFLEWEYGILKDETKNMALKTIKESPDYSLFISCKEQEKRKVTLGLLQEILSKPNDNPKKVKKTFIYKTLWQVGDILCIPIQNKFAYIHIVGVERTNHPIEELRRDCVYIKVFDVLTDTVLPLNAFKKLFSKINYVEINNNENLYKNKYIQQFWCLSQREKQSFEEKVIYVGNKKTKSQFGRSVSIYYQFKEIENTLTKIFYDQL